MPASVQPETVSFCFDLERLQWEDVLLARCVNTVGGQEDKKKKNKENVKKRTTTATPCFESCVCDMTCFSGIFTSPTWVFLPDSCSLSEFHGG